MIMFSEIKVAQMSAFILHLNGQKMSYLKLIKILYLAEREAVSRWGDSMSGDNFVSMPHGPVLSLTYNLITGGSRMESDGWNKFISGCANYEVSSNLTNPDRDDWDELSDAELAIIESIFNKFKHLTRWELVDYTHDNCKEWIDPKGSSAPISLEKIIYATCDKSKTAALISFSKSMNELSDARSIIQ
ncbi:hypothetical protein CKQ84_14305 [Shewanella sp. WE21]|uniref:Panacea domain-containing protein n=1 Tax=Shewanella sp. WE21 TaxID=2029986 RepID=UPI000CF6873D|nr:Panacea domain-containing protein [Shewanella sp. WE21]AVI66961.1 hypothetical protein CKQ84_14305 [Shewanella sp. WE21]